MGCSRKRKSQCSSPCIWRVGRGCGTDSGKNDCRPDQIRNPITGRCVKRDGAIGKKLMHSPNRSIEFSPSRSISERFRSISPPIRSNSRRHGCPPPEMGRCVRRTSSSKYDELWTLNALKLLTLRELKKYCKHQQISGYSRFKNRLDLLLYIVDDYPEKIGRRRS